VLALASAVSMGDSIMVMVIGDGMVVNGATTDDGDDDYRRRRRQAPADSTGRWWRNISCPTAAAAM
jgi:hypothetical protein